MVSTAFDELTEVASRQTRRQVFGLVGRGLIASAATSIGFGASRPRPAAAEDCVVEYPAANLADCPNKRHHPGHEASINGCGPDNWKGYLVSNTFFKANFKPGCDVHDVCYGTCGNSQAQCDMDLGRAGIEACKAAYDIAHQLSRAACISMARNYETAVSKLGAGPFNQAQLEDCECCRPWIFCGCNNKCYLTASRCTSECHASLACLGSVCRPAHAGECG